jgi:hypothetical protein
MSNDLVTQASRRPGAIAHLVRGASAYAHLKGPTLNLRASAAQTIHRSQDVSVYNASTQPVDALTSGGYSDIVIRHSPLINSISLRINLEHPAPTGSGFFTCRDVFFLFDHIDVLASGSTVIERIEPEQLWLAFSHLGVSEQSAIAWGLSGGQSANPDAVFNIAGAGGSSLFVPLLRCALSDHHVAVGFTTNEPITLRCYFRGPAWTGPENLLPTQPTIASFQAVVSGYEDAHELELQRRRYLDSNVPMHIRFSRPSHQRTVESMTSGRTTVRLSSVIGLVSSMQVMIRAVGATKNLDRITTVDILQNGSSIWGQPLDAVYLQSEEAAHEGLNASSYTIGGAHLALSLPIGSAGSRKGEARGAILGYRVFDGSSFELVITGPVLPADVEVVVIFRSFAVMEINRGRISIQQS